MDTELSGMRKFFQDVAEKRILGGEFVKEFTEIDDSDGGDGYVSPFPFENEAD